MYIDLEALRYLIYCSFKEIDKDTYDNFIDKFQATVSIEDFLEFLLKKNKITKYAINNFKITFPNQSYDNFLLFMKHIEIFDEELVSDIFAYLVSFYCAEILFIDEDDILKIFKNDYKEMSSHFKNLYTYKENDKFLRKTYSHYSYTGLITNEDRLTLKRSALPKFLEDYKFCIENNDEDNDVFEVNNGVFLRRDKRDAIDELICQLEVLSINGVENELFEKLKKELGL